MARKSVTTYVITSDVSGEQVAEADAVQVTVKDSAGRSWQLDASKADVQNLMTAIANNPKTEVKRRGRPAGSKNKPKDS